MDSGGEGCGVVVRWCVPRWEVVGGTGGQWRGGVRRGGEGCGVMVRWCLPRWDVVGGTGG